MVFGQKIGEVFSFNPVMAARQSKSGELPGAYPAEHGSVADTAAFGDKADREAFRNPLCCLSFHVNLLLFNSGLVSCQLSCSLALLALAVFVLFAVYVPLVTGKSHRHKNSSQKNHKVQQKKPGVLGK